MTNFFRLVPVRERANGTGWFPVVARLFLFLALLVIWTVQPCTAQGTIKLLFPAGRDYSIVKGQKSTLYHYSTTGFSDINGDGIPAAITSVQAVDDSALEWASLRSDYQSTTELVPPQDSLIFLDGAPTFGSAVTVDATRLKAGSTYRFTITSCTEPPVGGSGFRPCASNANLTVTVLPIPISLVAVTSPNGSYGTVRLFWRPAADPSRIISRYAILESSQDSITVNSAFNAVVAQPQVAGADTIVFLTGERYVPVWYSIAGYDSTGELVALSRSQQAVLRSGGFSLISPPDGAIISDQSVTLSWDGVPGEKFELWYGEDSLFGAKTVVRNLVPNSYRLPDTLRDHATYYWQVKTTTGTRADQWGWDFSFNRLNVRPQPFVLISPSGGDTVDSPRPEFRWEAAADSGDQVRYQLIVSSGASFADTVLQAIVTRTYFVSTTEFGNRQNFYWKVVAVDSRGATMESTARNFFLRKSVKVGTFALQEPKANGNVQYFEFPTETSLRPVFVWGAVAESLYGPVAYTVWYDTSARFTNPVVISNLAGASYQPAVDLLEDQRYFWKVEALTGSGPAPIARSAGFPAMFVTNGTRRNPASVKLLAPDEGARFFVGGVTLSWLNPPDDFYDSHLFDIEVKTDTVRTDSAKDWVYSGLFYQTSAVFYPTNITRYFWRVRTRSVTAFGDYGGVSYSAWRSFVFTGDLGTGQGEQVIPKVFTLGQNYPNPFNPTTELRYGIPQRSHIRIEVYNVLGERVAVLTEGIQDAGWHSLHWNATGVSSGIYFCRMQWDGGVNSRKLLLVK